MSRFWFRRFQFQIRFRQFWFGHLRRFQSQPALNRNIQGVFFGPKHPGGYFLDPQKHPKNAPQPTKLKTSKTHTNKPFQELSLKPSYSSHPKDAHSQILAPKGPNRAKIEFSGPNVRVKIQFGWFRFHLVPVPSVSVRPRFGSFRFGPHPVPVRSGSGSHAIPVQNGSGSHRFTKSQKIPIRIKTCKRRFHMFVPPAGRRPQNCIILEPKKPSKPIIIQTKNA